ncbi:MAG TPA: hypothetical protein VGL13_01555 [Polyangiaceae bacterium]
MALRAWSNWAVGLLPAGVVFAAAAWAEPGSGSNAPAVASASASVAASAFAALPVASAPSATPGMRLDPQGKTGMSPEMVRLREGHAAYMAHDFAAAVAAYKEALVAAPAEPSAYYFLGAAELAGGNASEADFDWQKGLKSSVPSDEWHTKLLYVVADLRERQSSFVEARKAWQELAQFADAHPSTKGAAASALQHIRAIDAHLDLEAKSAAVKQRIEQRQRETGTAPNAQGAAKPKP